MSVAQLALLVATVIGLVNAAFFSVVAYEISGHSLPFGIAGAVVVLAAEAVLVKVMGAKIGAQLNQAMAPQPGE